MDGELSEDDCVEYLISDEENYEKEFNELSEKIFSESLKAFVAKSKETDEVQYTLGEAVLWLIENGFEISSGNTGRIIRSGIDSDFEVAEYNELSGKPFNDIENAMEYANE